MSRPQKRRCSPSCSPGPSVRPRHDYVASSFHASPDVHSHFSSSATANATRPSTSRRYVGSQNSTGTSSPVSQPFTQSGVSNSNLVQMTAPHHSVDLHSAHLPCLTVPSGPVQPQQPSHENTGMFYKARDCAVTGTFVDASSVTYNNASSNHFMEKLLKETIRGAEHDSSARDPPPRCLPGTRLTILERCLYFISNCDGVQKIRWVVGAAGVGKSAIMQSVAESPDLPAGSPASVFFSINGRDDGTKAILTLSYQLAAKSDTYRQVIEHEITRDPSVLRSSMAKQFNKLIIEPFIHNTQPNPAGRVPIIIDGLDECKDPRTQLELLRLISDLCLTHPSSPLVWLIASRPEPHITSFFFKRNVIAVYEKEEVPIDSDESRADVERFLREKLMDIKEESDSLDPRWPDERDFCKVADAAGGLFAYAQTVVRYVGDRRVGSPASQLADVLHVIDKHAMAGLSREEHPMALLDALYERILSNVPDKIMFSTRKLLLALALSKDSTGFCLEIDMSFVVLCNWLGLSADEAYAAVYHLRSVLYVPRRDKAHKEKLETFHKSFMDYISDSTRSGFSPDFLHEANQLMAACTFRILMEVPNGIQSGLRTVNFTSGTLANGPATRDKIPLTWLVEESGGWESDKTRLSVYKLAIDGALNGIKRADPNFQTVFCLRFLTTVWSSCTFAFPYNDLLNVVFDRTRQREFMMCGLLKSIPLTAVPDYGIDWHCDIKLEFRRPTTTAKDISNPWNSSCWHAQETEQSGGWSTTFRRSHFGQRDGVPQIACLFCYKRFRDQLEKWKADFADSTALVFLTSTGECCVQVRFVYPEDGMSEWTYSFWCYLPRAVREKFRSTV